MTFYEDKNDKNSHAVLNDDRYLVIHWGYREALDKYKVLLQRYDWMRTYIAMVTKQEGKKFFVWDGDADEINQMMEEIDSKQKEIYKLLKIGK